MNATAIRERRQTTLPGSVCEAASVGVGDMIEWRYEDGEIRGRPLFSGPRRFSSEAAALAALRASPLKFKGGWDDTRGETR